MERLIWLGIIIVLIIIIVRLSREQSIPDISDIYFMPEDNIQERICKEIEQARISVDVAIYEFTSQKIASFLKHSPVKVRIIMDRTEATNNKIYHYLKDRVKLLGYPNVNPNVKMHNKFIVIDERLLITGSYNLTYNAEHRNYENAMFIYDERIIKAYKREFEYLWGLKMK